MSLEAEAFLKRPVARVLTVRCDRFHDGDSVVLIGDAAHAVFHRLVKVQCVAGGCADFRTLVGDV